ncbi:MAG: radical SAM protein [Ruminococcaceae bacterium]|nr:radical SAM protein [Oscillospiraceae bacterium]
MHIVQAKSILSANNGMNIYRGCSHGCIYCDARSDCYQMNHAFEDIEVKINAPQLLEAALKSKRRLCMIGTGAMSDPYCTPERELKLTRQCLELIAKYGFGAAVLTKSDLVMRDIDLLEEINTSAKAVVQMTLTTADESLCRIVEPNVCSTARRAEVLMEMKKRGIPTVMWLTPILPFINDTESNIRKLVQIGAEAGVQGIITFGIGMTLRSGDREYFYTALDKHFPGVKQRYIRTFGEQYEIPSPNGEKLWAAFINECERYNIEFRQERIFQYMSEFPEPQQFTLF